MPRKPNLSRLLRDARIKRRLSVLEVAEMVGVKRVDTPGIVQFVRLYFKTGDLCLAFSGVGRFLEQAFLQCQWQAEILRIAWIHDARRCRNGIC